MRKDRFAEVFGFVPATEGSTVPTIEAAIVSRVIKRLEERLTQERRVMRQIDHESQASDLSDTKLNDLLHQAREQEAKVSRTFNDLHEAIGLAREFGRYR